MNQIKFRAIGTFITKCLKEYEWDEVLFDVKLKLITSDILTGIKNPEYETLLNSQMMKRIF